MEKNLHDIFCPTLSWQRGDTELAPIHQCNVGMYSEYSHRCLWKRTCMTSFVLPSRGSGVLTETKGYEGLLLIENRNKALALTEYMNSSNYGHHREWSRLLSLRGCRIITHSR